MRTTGEGLAGMVDGGTGGGGGADGAFDAAGGALLGAGRPLLRCGTAVVATSGATVVVCTDPRDTSSTPDATIAATATAAAAFVRYHGGPTRTRRGSMSAGSQVPTAAAGRSVACSAAGTSSSPTVSAALRRRSCTAVTAIGSVIASSGSRASVSGSEPPGSAASTCEAVSTRDAVPGGMSIDRTKAGVSSASSAARRRTRRSINRLTRPTAPTLTALQAGPHTENRARRAGRSAPTVVSLLPKSGRPGESPLGRAANTPRRIARGAARLGRTMLSCTATARASASTRTRRCVSRRVVGSGGEIVHGGRCGPL